jgi:hypothetical protein
MNINFNLFNSISSFLFLFGLVFCAIIFFKLEESITLNFKSDYFVFSKNLILTSSIIYFSIITFGYFIRAEELNQNLTKTHILISIISLVSVLILFLLLKENTKDYDVVNLINNANFNSKIEKAIWILLPIFLLSQLLFIINFIMSFFRKPF